MSSEKRDEIDMTLHLKGTGVVQKFFDGAVELRSVSVSPECVPHFIVSRIEYCNRLNTDEERAELAKIEAAMKEKAREFHIDNGHVWCDACGHCRCSARMHPTLTMCDACTTFIANTEADPPIAKHVWERFRAEQQALWEPRREIIERSMVTAYRSHSETREEMLATFGKGSLLLSGRVPEGLPLTLVVRNESTEPKTFRARVEVELVEPS
jgi:hypothetical protein